MKKIIAILIIFSGIAFAEMPKPTDRQNDIFTTLCYDWFEKNWLTIKHFEDGEMLYQPIHKMELIRVENDILLVEDGDFRETDTEIYHIAIYFTANYYDENGQLKEKKNLLQVVYMHILHNKVIEADFNPAITWNKT